MAGRPIIQLAMAMILAATAAQAAERRPVTREAQVVRVLERFEQDWRRGDIPAMAEMITDDVQYVNGGSGFWWRGKAEVQRGWANERTGGAMPKVVERTVRFPARGVAIVISRYAVPSGKLPNGVTYPASKALSTSVLVERTGRWLITSGQTTIVLDTPPP